MSGMIDNPAVMKSYRMLFDLVSSGETAECTIAPYMDPRVRVSAIAEFEESSGTAQIKNGAVPYIAARDAKSFSRQCYAASVHCEWSPE